MTERPTPRMEMQAIARRSTGENGDPTEWGRIDSDGTVFVRDGDGERAIGSWMAGSVAEGLAFFGRKYDDLVAEVRLLEHRVAVAGSDTKTIGASARKLLEGIPTAAVIGDLATLTARLRGVLDAVEARRAEASAQRAAASVAAADAKRALVAEAQTLSTSQSWRAGSDRFRAIVEQWKSIKGVDRSIDSELWEQFAAARREFDKRRRAAAAAADVERARAAERKEALVRQAEKLAGSTEWTDTARRFRDLMSEWKAAGRAGKETDDRLWESFKAAQDTFFAARSTAFSARDDEQKANLEAKRALLAEAEAIDLTNPQSARKHLRRVQDRWDAVGRVPRESMADLEARLAAVEERLRDASDAKRPVSRTESTLVIRLRESVGKLENRLKRAEAAGDTRLAEETLASLTTQREWLAQAESSS